MQKRTSCHVDAYAGCEQPRCRAVSMSCDVRSTYLPLSPASLRVWTPPCWLGMEVRGCHVGAPTAHGSHFWVPRARFPPPSWLGMEARGPHFGVRRAVRSPHDEAQMLKCKNDVFTQKTLYPARPARIRSPFFGSKWRDQCVKSCVSPRRNAQNPIKTNIFMRVDPKQRKLYPARFLEQIAFRRS